MDNDISSLGERLSKLEKEFPLELVSKPTACFKNCNRSREFNASIAIKWGFETSSSTAHGCGPHEPVPNRNQPQLLTCRCEQLRYIKPAKSQKSPKQSIEQVAAANPLDKTTQTK